MVKSGLKRRVFAERMAKSLKGNGGGEGELGRGGGGGVSVFFLACGVDYNILHFRALVLFLSFMVGCIESQKRSKKKEEKH